MAALYEGRVRELCPGILELQTLPENDCSELVQTLEAYEWRTSTIAEVRGLSRIEYAREDIRSSLSIGEPSARAQMKEILERLEHRVLQSFVDYWGISQVRPATPQFTKYGVGHFIKDHTDDGAAFPHRVGSAVTYLTDTYQGGEIAFPKFNLQLRPRVGTTLIFPSEYVHAVRPIASGEKVVFLFFVEVTP